MAAMERDRGTFSDAEAASALAWWAEAGVDTIVGEAPRDWLNPKPRAAAPVARPAPAAAWPDSLDAFQAWLAETGDLPFASPSAPRIAPAGDPACGLMIMTDMPSPEDLRAGILLSGDAGRLFDRMLAAIGRSRATVYLAPLSPFCAPGGRIDEADLDRLAAIARHHVGLAAPRALLLFGDSCAKALLGRAVAGARGKWHEPSTPAGPVRSLATIRPEKLLKQPALKALAWADLQMLMEGLKS